MTTTTAPDAARTAEDTRFDDVIQRWFDDRLELQPEWATYLGIHAHDHRLSPGGREGVEADVAFTRAAVAAMETFDPTDLSPNRALDRDLLIHEARLNLFELTERRSWQGRSDAAEAIGGALFPLFTRDFAPMAERVESIAARLEAAPRYLEETHDRVEQPPAGAKLDSQPPAEAAGRERATRRDRPSAGGRSLRHFHATSLTPAPSVH